MDLVLLFAILLISIVGLYYGADFLIRGAVDIANYFKISKMVIALTLVAAGTSMPEFFVTLLGAIKGKPDIAVGNIVGSNIANITLVLAIACLIFPFTVKRRTRQLDFPIVIALSALFFWFMQDGLIARHEGLILFALFLAYIFFFLLYAKKKPDAISLSEVLEHEGKVEYTSKFLLISSGFVLLGVALLYGASEGLIYSAVEFARMLGLSESVIGFTMVAIGTSIPEIFTSAIAAFKHEEDISFGNVLGSNFLNIAMVMGLVSFISPVPVQKLVAQREALAMLAITAAVYPLAFARRLGRMAGFIMLAIYIFFLYMVFR
jgi:cation:H+ antiporter